MKLSATEKTRVAAQVAAIRAAVEAQIALRNAMRQIGELSAQWWCAPNENTIHDLALDLSLDEKIEDANIKQWILNDEPGFWRDPKEAQ